jgi:hypothetical protein
MKFKPDMGVKRMDTGCWMLDTGYWMLDVRYWMLDYNRQAFGAWLTAYGERVEV